MQSTWTMSVAGGPTPCTWVWAAAPLSTVPWPGQPASKPAGMQTAVLFPRKFILCFTKKNHRQDFWCVLASIDASGLCTKMGDYGTGMAYENGTQTFYKTCCKRVQFFKKVIFLKFLKLSLFSWSDTGWLCRVWVWTSGPLWERHFRCACEKHFHQGRVQVCIGCSICNNICYNFCPKETSEPSSSSRRETCLNETSCTNAAYVPSNQDCWLKDAYRNPPTIETSVVSLNLGCGIKNVNGNVGCFFFDYISSQWMSGPSGRLVKAIVSTEPGGGPTQTVMRWPWNTASCLPVVRHREVWSQRLNWFFILYSTTNEYFPLSHCRAQNDRTSHWIFCPCFLRFNSCQRWGGHPHWSFRRCLLCPRLQKGQAQYWQLWPVQLLCCGCRDLKIGICYTKLDSSKCGSAGNSWEDILWDPAVMLVTKTWNIETFLFLKELIQYQMFLPFLCLQNFIWKKLCQSNHYRAHVFNIFH